MVRSINQIKLINLKNQTINFGGLLTNDYSLIIKNCSNVKIIIKTKINKIIIEKSNKIYIDVDKLITGFEITNSKYVLISCDNSLETKAIPFIDVNKSSVYLIGDIQIYLETIVIIEQAEVYNINFFEEN